MQRLIMITSLILQLARGIWFIEPASAAAYKPVVSAILSGKNVDFSALMPKAYHDDSRETKKKSIQSFVLSLSPSQFQEFGNLNEAPVGSIAITPLHGVVMKEDFCGAPGTKTLQALMQESDRSPNIIAHILHVDSPGGAANATMDISEAIKSLSKPVLTFSDGMMASAAYWIGSSGKHIMASNTLNQIGSIGTYLTITDWSKADEMAGIKETDVYATKSTEKNIQFRKALEGDFEPIRTGLIDTYNEAFLSAVKRNRFSRNLSESNTLKGQSHFTPAALKFGLIDSVGNFNDAIQKVKSLIK